MNDQLLYYQIAIRRRMSICLLPTVFAAGLIGGGFLRGEVPRDTPVPVSAEVAAGEAYSAFYQRQGKDELERMKNTTIDWMVLERKSREKSLGHRELEDYAREMEKVLDDHIARLRGVKGLTETTAAGLNLFNSFANVIKAGVPQSGVYVAGLQELAKHGAEWYDDRRAPELLDSSEQQIFSFFQFHRRFEKEVLTRRREAALSDAEIHQWVTQRYTMKYGVGPEDDAKSIFEKDVDLEIPSLLRELLSRQQEGFATIAEVLQAALGDSTSPEALLKTLSEELIIAEQQNPDRIPPPKTSEEQDAALRVREREMQLIKNAQAVVNLAAGALSFVDPKLANRVSVIGGSTLQVADAVSALKAQKLGGFLGLGKGFGGVMNAVSLAGNVLGAVTAIASLFGPETPSADQLILEQIAELRKDIQRLREEMHQRFDMLDARLDALLARIDVLFGRVFEGLAAIRRDLYEISVELQRIEANVLAYIEETEWRRFREEVILCVALQDTFPSLSLDQYRECYAKFYAWATLFSKDPISLGGATRSFDVGDLARELSQHPWETNVAYILEFARRQGWSQNVEVPPNPMVWRVAADALMDLVLYSPENTQQLNVPGLVANLEEVISVGQQIRDAARAATEVGLYGGISSAYAVAFTNLREALVEAHKNFIQMKWSEANPNWTVRAEHIRPSDAEGISVELPFDDPQFGPDVAAALLSLPPGYSKTLPIEWIQAEIDGLGKIDVFYHSVKWADVTRNATVLDRWNLSARPNIMVTAVFEVASGGDLLPIQTRGFQPDLQPGCNFIRIESGRGDFIERQLYLGAFLPQLWETGYLGAGCCPGMCANTGTIQYFPMKSVIGDQFTVRCGPDACGQEQQSLGTIKQIVETHWSEKYKEEIKAKILGEFHNSGTPIERHSRELTGLRRFTETFLRLSRSRSVGADERWRSPLYGTRRAPGGNDVEDYIRGGGSPAVRTREYQEDLWGPWHDLANLIEASLQDGSVEPFDAVEDTLVRLENTKVFVEAQAYPPGLSCWPFSSCIERNLSFIRGDATMDASVDISDAVRILAVLFIGAEKLPCESAADVDDNGRIEITDAIALLGSLFLGNVVVPSPHPACGVDPTPDTLSCDRPGFCQL